MHGKQSQAEHGSVAYQCCPETRSLLMKVGIHPRPESSSQCPSALHRMPFAVGSTWLVHVLVHTHTVPITAFSLFCVIELPPIVLCSKGFGVTTRR
eukprot:2315959-Amphidinium_carterae.1